MKNIYLFLFLITLQCCFSFNASAQYPFGEINGKVSDAETGEPMPFATVKVEGSGQVVGTSTDFDGIYAIKGLRPGLYTVTFSSVGYQTQTIEKVKINADKTTFLNAKLSSSSELLDVIEVREYKVPLLQHDQTTTESTVTSEQIQSMPTRNVSSIAGQAAGVYSEGKSKKRRKNKNTASRTNATHYYVDGLKVKGNSPQASKKKNTAAKKASKAAKPKPPKKFPSLKSAQEALAKRQKAKAEKTQAPSPSVAASNPLLSVKKAPLSTFSIDVDKASYSYLRSTLNSNSLPNPDDVRIEEMINYFEYQYPHEEEKVPFSVTTELSDCPWNPQHQLALIGLQGRDIEMEQVPPQNLVFLMDVSGSMSSPNKLPLLKSAFRLLIGQLRPEDKVAIVVYAGAAGVVLNPTNGDKKTAILDALTQLQAGGSTAGGAGIELAYNLAQQNFESGSNNRVILATDGDFNVGTSSEKELVKLIENKRKTGIFLTVLGFGTGNYQDRKMEELSNHGNGNYAYIDNLKEAKKVLINELSSTLFTIAKDVKLQVEFNPKEVKAYRLIGYTNRRLADEDFNNDAKDAGEIGAGHSVTALYELVPSHVPFEDQSSNIDPLKYQKQKANRASASANNGEVLTVKVRHKAPNSNTSTKTEYILSKSTHTPFNKASENLQLASTTATFGMLLQNADFHKNLTFNDVLKMANKAVGKDEKGYRKEMIQLIEKAQRLTKEVALSVK